MGSRIRHIRPGVRAAVVLIQFLLVYMYGRHRYIRLVRDLDHSSPVFLVISRQGALCEESPRADARRTALREIPPRTDKHDQGASSVLKCYVSWVLDWHCIGDNINGQRSFLSLQIPRPCPSLRLRELSMSILWIPVRDLELRRCTYRAESRI